MGVAFDIQLLLEFVRFGSEPIRLLPKLVRLLLKLVRSSVKLIRVARPAVFQNDAENGEADCR